MAKAAPEGVGDTQRQNLDGVATVATNKPSLARYRFRIADERDDAPIRQLLRETPMDGPIRVSLRCEPSYFQTTRGGRLHQTLVACEQTSGRIVGMGVRSVRTRYVDGQATNVGYLSGLRILEPHRRGTLLARGYREIRRLHADGISDYYVTTIVDGNRPAFASLTPRRASLPNYFRLGQYHTFVLPIHRGRSPNHRGELFIRPMADAELPQVVSFLHREGRRKLFFPCYQQEDFASASSTFQGLRNEDVLIAWRQGELVGLLGTWNQSSMKQCVIEGYRPMLRLIRPAFNGVARCVGWPSFPASGQPLPTIVAAFPLVRDDDPQILSQLLRAAGIHVRQHHPQSQSILIGAFERDPLFDSIGRASIHRFVSHVFLVYWDEALVRPEHLLERNLYLELGCL